MKRGMGEVDEELALEGEIDEAMEALEASLAPFSALGRERALIRMLARTRRQHALLAAQAAPPVQAPAPRAPVAPPVRMPPPARMPPPGLDNRRPWQAVVTARVAAHPGASRPLPPTAGAVPAPVAAPEEQDEEEEEEEEEEEDEGHDNVVTSPGTATLMSRLHEMLLAYPRRPIKDLASDLYGTDDDKSRGKVRSLLDQLKRRGKARAVEHGLWEAMGEAS